VVILSRFSISESVATSASSVHTTWIATSSAFNPFDINNAYSAAFIANSESSNGIKIFQILEVIEEDNVSH
jgi:hypothetical protein